MKLRRIIIAGIMLDIVVGAVMAASLVVSPDPCPVPAEAEAYVPPDDLSPAQSGMRLKVAEPIIEVRDQRHRFGARPRIFAWFEHDDDGVRAECSGETAAPQ